MEDKQVVITLTELFRELYSIGHQVEQLPLEDVLAGFNHARKTDKLLLSAQDLQKAEVMVKMLESYIQLQKTHREVTRWYEQHRTRN